MALLASAQGVGNTTGSPINTTGAKLLVAFVSYDGSQTFTDSKGNTWTGLTERSNSTTRLRPFYVINPANVGTSHTFSSTVSYSRVVVMAFDDDIDAYEAENWATSGTFTVSEIECGSITPSADNFLLVCGSPMANSISSIAVDSSFTVAQAVGGTSGVSYGGSGAYQLQTTATTRNPKWTWSGGSARTLGIQVAFSTNAASGVTGTSATTNANDTSSASGSTTIVGSSATTNANDTSSASGSTTIVGSVAATNANDTSTATGTVGSGITGSAAVTNANDTASASGSTTIVGTVAYTNANDTSNATGFLPISGSASVTNANDTAAAFGTFGDEPVGFDGGFWAEQWRRIREKKPEPKPEAKPWTEEEIEQIAEEVREALVPQRKPLDLTKILDIQQSQIKTLEKLRELEDEDDIEALMLL